MVDTLTPHVHVAGTNDLDGLPIDAAKMFADHKGVHKPGIEKKQRKLVKKLDFLSEFLEEGEQLLAVTTAVSPTSFLEQWTTGFIFVYLKRCMLVFTDRRVFHIPTTAGFKYRSSVAEIRYGDLQSIQQKGSRLKVTYESGQKDLFLYVRRSERKKIRALLDSVNLQGAPGNGRGRLHLCPDCTTQLEADNYECPNCSLEFKNRKTALKRSWLIPGGGYFYTGHPFLGIADAFFEIILIAAIVAMLIPGPTSSPGDYTAAIALGVLLLVEKLITVYHANHFIKEYLTHDARGPKDGPVVATLKWAGMGVVLVFVALAVFGLLMDVGVVPSERVLDGDEVPAEHYTTLIAEEIIDENEVIEMFYSEGLLSIREGGSILTDYRVISYQENADDLVDIYEIWNEDLVSVEQTQMGDAMNFSVYRVTGQGEDMWLELWLPHEQGDGERFAEAIEAKITISESESP